MLPQQQQQANICVDTVLGAAFYNTAAQYKPRCSSPWSQLYSVQGNSTVIYNCSTKVQNRKEYLPLTNHICSKIEGAGECGKLRTGRMFTVNELHRNLKQRSRSIIIGMQHRWTFVKLWSKFSQDQRSFIEVPKFKCANIATSYGETTVTHCQWIWNRSTIIYPLTSTEQ